MFISLVRQMPSTEVLEMAKALDHFQGMLRKRPA